MQQLCAYKTNNGHTGIGINAYLGENPENISGLFGTRDSERGQVAA